VFRRREKFEEEGRESGGEGRGENPSGLSLLRWIKRSNQTTRRSNGGDRKEGDLFPSLTRNFYSLSEEDVSSMPRKKLVVKWKEISVRGEGDFRSLTKKCR